jgi:hypothetical protein
MILAVWRGFAPTMATRRATPAAFSSPEGNWTMAATQQSSPAPHPTEVAELGVPTFFVSSEFRDCRLLEEELPASAAGQSTRLEVRSTLCWREVDSNHRSREEGQGF